MFPVRFHRRAVVMCTPQTAASCSADSPEGVLVLVIHASTFPTTRSNMDALRRGAARPGTKSRRATIAGFHETDVADCSTSHESDTGMCSADAAYGLLRTSYNV